MPCHGNPTGDHCCYVNGTVCSNLLVGAAITTAIDAGIASRKIKGQARTLARTLNDGVTHVCGAAIKVQLDHIAATGALPARAVFEAAWSAHPDYAPVAAVWASLGKPANWCATFGPAEQQCCFAEPVAVNDSKMNALPVEVRGIRAAIGQG